jgi:hypothetical protein
MYSRNRRLAAVLAAAVLGAGPALAAGAAQAAPATPSVEFSGGSVLNMLVCRSQPSTGKLVVPAESRVIFINRLGQNATLRMDGRTVTSVGANQAVPVVFHRGPVGVSMTISCNAGVVEEFQAVTVAVTPAAVPPAPAAAANPPASSGGGAARGSGGAAARATSSARTASSPPAVDAGVASADPWASSAGLPASGGSSPAPGTGEGATGEPGSAAVDVGDVVAASGEPVHGPSGLLAMIATVLTVGVGVAAMRSILARRTSRARFA